MVANMVALNRSPTLLCIDLTNNFDAQTTKNKAKSPCPLVTSHQYHLQSNECVHPIKTVLFSSENSSRSHKMGTICVVCPLGIWYEHV